MKRFLASIALLAVAVDAAANAPVPLPRPRPPVELMLKYGPPAAFAPADFTVAQPSPCLVAIQNIAVAEAIALTNGPDFCGVEDLVRLKAVRMTDGREVAVTPPAELRCPMAASLAAWLRDELPSAIGEPGLARVVGYNSYECRPRNRIFGVDVKLSEHARGNAIDIRALVRTDGVVIDPTAVTESRSLREAIRGSACARFSTVLGPGSDGHHEKHIHVDVAERRSNYKVCQWTVRDPPPLVAVAGAIPLPPPRPAIADGNASEATAR